MHALAKLEKYLTLALDVFVSFCFTVILILTILQVFLRYGFNSAILGGNEAMESLFIYTTAIGAAVAIRRRQHISIDFLLDLLPLRIGRITQSLGLFLIAVLNGVMIYYSVPWITKVGGNESPVMRIPEWTMQISIPIGCGLVIIYCFYEIAQLFLVGGETSPEDCP